MSNNANEKQYEYQLERKHSTVVSSMGALEDNVKLLNKSFPGENGQNEQNYWNSFSSLWRLQVLMDLNIPHTESQSVRGALNREQSLCSRLFRLGVGHLHLWTALGAGGNRNVLVVSSTNRDQMCVINSGMNRNRCGRADVLVAMIVDHILKVIRLEANVILQDMVVDWTGGSL